MIYITYKEGETVKKGCVDESRLSKLRSNPQIKEVIVYPNEIIMETNYNNMVCKDGKCDNKNFLLG